MTTQTSTNLSQHITVWLGFSIDFHFCFVFFLNISKMEIHWNWVRGQITGNDKNLWAQNFFVRDQISFFCVWATPTGEIKWFRYCLLEYFTMINLLGHLALMQQLKTFQLLQQCQWSSFYVRNTFHKVTNYSNQSLNIRILPEYMTRNIA